MKAAGFALGNAHRLSAAQAIARVVQVPFARKGVIRHLPGMLSGWTAVRDLRPAPKESFRQWWSRRKANPE